MDNTKQFTLQDLKNAFIAGESFESDTIGVDMGEKDEVTEPDFGEWVKESYDIDVE
jgi:hypothetical protein